MVDLCEVPRRDLKIFYLREHGSHLCLIWTHLRCQARTFGVWVYWRCADEYYDNDHWVWNQESTKRKIHKVPTKRIPSYPTQATLTRLRRKLVNLNHDQSIARFPIWQQTRLHFPVVFPRHSSLLFSSAVNIIQQKQWMISISSQHSLSCCQLSFLSNWE